MIKRLVDALRGREGYAGMAVYHEDILLFCDAMDADLAEKNKRLYMEGENIFHAACMASVIRGFTVSTFRSGDLLVVCMFEGQFIRPPPPAPEDTVQYAPGREEEHPLTREEARREAELMLQRLLV
jgi:hypothetical protein